MKKIFENDNIIIIDTENNNTINPIVLFYNKKEIRLSYDEPIQKLPMNEFDELVYSNIYFYCKKNKVYDKKIESIKENINAYKEKGLREIVDSLEEWLNKYLGMLTIADNEYKKKEVVANGRNKTRS